MAKLAQWIEGARPRTLPAATAPVMAGTATAWHQLGSLTFRQVVLALLAGVVALALQVGVNYANDYSDGIRGTDNDRVGPMRLVGSGAAAPQQVKWAAFGCFAVAGLAGLLVVVITSQVWLLGVGLASILAAWFYTGGQHPYGYAGLGEVFVFVFFGLVAVCGTHVVVAGSFTLAALAGAISTGSLACALLVVNNLRDIPTDQAADKHTLATRLGDGRTRTLFAALVALAVAGVVVVAGLTSWWALLALALVAPAAHALGLVLGGARGGALVASLKSTGIAELVMGAGLLGGTALAHLF